MDNQQPNAEFTKEDINKNKGMAVLAYIIFLIPLLAARESKFAKFHTNQGLLLFIAGVALNIISQIMPAMIYLILVPLANLAIFVLAILGIINAAKGEAKPLPLIGGIVILK